MDTQNITLSIPKDILRKIKLIAVKQDTSVSGLMTQALEEIVVREEGYRAARRRHLKALDTGVDMATNGNPGWTREELHDR
jgi:predicted transcriptional regulator